MAKRRRTGFVSYAHRDAALVERFLNVMQPRCASLRDLEIELWSDRMILAGQDWAREIAVAAEAADFGLLCVSPSFLASPFVTEVELPALMAGSRTIIPVALEPLALDLLDLKGLDPLQIFHLRPPRSARGLSFDECKGRGVNEKRFCDALVAELVAPTRRRAGRTAATLQLGAAARSLRGLAHRAGATSRSRIERLAVLAEADPDGRDLNLGGVVDALYPGDADGVERFRQLRQAMRALADEYGIAIACEVDGQKRSGPEARRCWFTGVDDEVERIEWLSHDASQSPPGTVAIRARARREILRICIDGPATASGDELTGRLTAALTHDVDLGLEVTSTRALADEHRELVRARRLAGADLVVCLLSPEYLAEHGDSAADGGRPVVPVALERLDEADLGRLAPPFALRGKAFEEHGSDTAQFVAALHEHIVHRVTRRTIDALEWDCLLPSDVARDVVDARAIRALLDRAPRTAQPPDDTIDVQRHLRAWADDAGGRPYLVIFGEYGMGKTTACQAFTRDLLARRRAGDVDARLPIYLDLRNLGDVKLREPTLAQILDDLLSRAWQSGLADRPTADEVVDYVQHRRAVVVFDGLDEVLVHLSDRQGQALLRQLWSILPPKLHSGPRAGRVLMTCRTHFFRTLAEQQTYFRGEDRDAVGAGSYAALHLLPFNEQQMRAYLERRDVSAADGGGVERAIELIRAVHNLSDLVTRPYNLHLVADQLGALERRIASGERVDAAALYDELVGSWLARDEGKHQLRKHDKLRLMEELAAELWREGRRSLPVDRLEAWLHRRLGADDELGRWFALARPDVAVLAEDLRTATFVVRPGADDFAFAHTSLLEYFLARRLVRALEESDPAAWAMPLPSPETLDFLGELVAARDTAMCLGALRALRATYREQCSEAAFAYCLRAAERGAPSVAVAGFALHGARLRGIEVAGPADGPRLSLAGSTFAGADLRDARFRRVDLAGCDLREADLTRAELHDCGVDEAKLAGAKLTATIFRRCRARRLALREARAHRTQWLRCDVGDMRWPEGEAHLVAHLDGCTPMLAGLDPGAARAGVFTGHRGQVWGVAFSPDGGRLVSGGDDGSVRVWDAGGGEGLLRLDGHAGAVRGVAFSPDGGRVVSGGADGLVRVWDAAGGEQLLRLDGHAGAVRGVAFSPDGGRLVSGGADGSVRVWDAAGGEELLRLDGHHGSVRGVAFSADGGRLVSGGADGSVRVWDAAGGEELLRVERHRGGVWGVAFSPDGRQLVSCGGDGSVRVWDAAGGEELLRLNGHGDTAWAVAFSPDGGRLVSGGVDGSVRVWDAAGGEELLRLEGDGGGVLGVAFSPDGGRFVSGGADGSVRVWDAAGGEQLLHLDGHRGMVWEVAFSPDGGRLVSGGDDGSLRVWDTASGEHLLRLDGPRSGLLGAAFSPDGTRMMSGGDDGSVWVWDAAHGEQLLCLDGHRGWVSWVAFSPDGGRLASCGADASVRVWDAVCGKQLLCLDNHEGVLWGVAFSPDGGRLVSGGDDGSVWVWDAARGKQLLRLDGHRGGISGVAFSPDGGRLVSGGDDGSVRVWDAAGGEELLRLEGDGGGVRGVAFSPDGGRLVSGGADGLVRVWDAAGGEELLRLDGHRGGVLGVAFSPDGGRLVSGGGDGLVRVWDAAGGEELLAVHALEGGEHAALAGGRVTSCSEGAWRWLGWLARSPVTGALTRYPAEMFGPLPVKR